MSEYEDRCINMPNEVIFNDYEDALKDYENRAMKNQAQIVARIREYIERINTNQMLQEMNIFSRNIIISSLNRLLSIIRERLVIDFSKQKEKWAYSIYIFEEKSQIRYEQIGYSSSLKQWMIEAYDTFCEVENVLYSVNEYAEAYNVCETTVREWIRRGKISNAIKKGSEWFIPALVVPINRADCSIFCKRISFDDDFSDTPFIDQNAYFVNICKSKKKGLYYIQCIDESHFIYDDIEVPKNEAMIIRRRLLESPDYKIQSINIIYADNY